MDPLQIKYPKGQIVDLTNLLKFKKSPIMLVGTGALNSQYYPADYDYLSKIIDNTSLNDTYYNLKKILDNINSQDDLFFIELKLQDKDGKKKKIFKLYHFDLDDLKEFYNNLELVKIDMIIFINGIFKEVSVIYFFSDEKLDLNKYVKTLLEDQVEYYKKKSYYKSLKRLLVVNKYLNPPDNNLVITISNLFNSQVGKLYELKNIIDAGLMFYDKYHNNKLFNIFLDNIGLSGISIDNLKKLNEDYDKIINREGLKFYKKYNLKAGELPAYNSIKP